MERIRELNRCQKAILVILIAMVSVFTIIYSIAFSKTGFVYDGTFMEKRSENGDTVYSGRIKGEELTYTVTADHVLYCRYGDKTYGPYTARKDPTAVPKGNGRADEMVGVEIREGEEILFRGGALMIEGNIQLIKKTTGDINMDVTVSVVGRNDFEPSVHMILRLLGGPELTKGGNFWCWFFGVLVAGMTVFSMLFAEELFHFAMSFRVRYAELTDPSDWEILSRYVGWILSTVVTLVVFFSGLTMYI